MAIFSLMACFTATYAWFNAVKNKSFGVDNFGVVAVDTSVTAISVHQFLGTSDDGNSYCFNPTPDHSIVWDDGSGTDSTGFTMDTYSLNDPHHPVLFLFAVSGISQVIDLVTDYSYLANDEPESTKEDVANYDALIAGTYVNNDIIQVDNDNRHGGSKTKYKYVVPSEGDPYFEMVWIDIALNNNPLSSIIVSHYFLFEDDPSDNEGTYQKQNKVINEVSTSCLPIDVSGFLDSNSASFVEFDGNNVNFNKRVKLFDGDISGMTHIGIVVDYFNESLEYIYSFFLGHDALNNENGLHFRCDWTMEI